MPAEYVTRELFDRSEQYMLKVMEKNNENSEKVMAAMNKNELSLERLIVTVEKTLEEIKEIKQNVRALEEEVTRMAATEGDRRGRLDNHAESLKELKEKPVKKMEAIATSIITGVIMLLIGVLAGYIFRA